MAQPFFSEKFSRQLLNMVALGHVENNSLVLGFGDNDDVGTAREDLWTAGGVIVQPASAFVASLVSTDADDTEAGAGAQTVTVTGLDADWEVVSETVDMDGLTPALTTQTFIRINQCVVASSGASGWNEGAITVSLNSNVQATIEAEEGISHDCHYSVPAGHTLYIVEATTWQAKDFSAETGLYYRQFGGSWASPGHFDSYRNQVHVEIHGGIAIQEKGDIKFMGLASGAGAGVYVYWVGLLRRN